MLDVGLRVGVSGSSQGDANVTGFSILEAESMEAAIAMVQSHPHLRYAEGCEIEVREYLTRQCNLLRRLGTAASRQRPVPASERCNGLLSVIIYG